MTLEAVAQAAVARVAPGLDWFRSSTTTRADVRGHKEWQHFCIQGPGIDLIANFGVAEDTRPSAAPGRGLGRLVMMAKTEDWTGDVEAFAPHETHLRPGRIDATFGENSLCFKAGAYRIRAKLRHRDLAVEADLVPLALPAPAYDFDLPDGPPIHWLVMPRLRASGTVRLRGRTFDLNGSLAYHDHNWGSFSWGSDFAWEWGFGLPERSDNPWTIVFARMTNRNRTHTLSQTVFLWRGQRLVRVFHADDVDFTPQGFLSQERVVRVPAVMGLLTPGRCADVPQSVRVAAAADGDSVVFDLESDEFAQVVVPNDHELGVTVINEVAARFVCHGRVRGETIRFGGRASFESVGG